MAEQKGLEIVLAGRPQGHVRLNDLQAKEASIPTVSPGGLVVEVNYLSLYPCMCGRMDDRESYAERLKVGDVMPGEGIGTVIASQSPEGGPRY